MSVEIQMPQMGESVTEGTVLEWHVAEGDAVEEGDTVVEVSTDKVDAEVPAPASGVISKILAQPEDNLQGGEALAELDANGKGGSGTATQTSEQTGGEQGGNHPAAAGREAEEAAGNSSTATATTDDSSVSAGGTTASGELQVVMPEMGESVSEGTVLEWHVAEGGSIEEGQTIVEVSTDKVDAEVPAPTSGVVTSILAQPDDTVAVGAVLATIKPGEVSGDGASARAPEKAAPATSTAPAETGNGRATPVARRVAAERGIDLAKVDGSGAGGK